MSIFNYPYRWISTLISKQGYPCKDILQCISMEHKYPLKNTTHLLWISFFHYRCFCGYPSIGVCIWICMDFHAFLWTSMDFYVYPCMDLRWILDPENDICISVGLAFQTAYNIPDLTWLHFLHINAR